MDSASNIRLPVINLTEEILRSGKDSWTEARNRVTRAFEEYGCFIAVHDKYPSEVSDSIFSELQDLFDLPLEIKVQNTSQIPLFGYFGASWDLPLYETTSIEDATNLEAVQKFTNQMWPSKNNHFCELLHCYANQAAELDKMVSKLVFESYGVEKYHESHVGSVTYIVRFTKYRVPEQNETNVGVLPHTDKNFITILHQNDARGLEIQLKNGSWIPVDFPPSSVVIMAGDAFSVWSNGRVHSPLHRVTMKGKGRYSIAQFAFCKKLVETPTELVDDEHPLLYKPFDSLGFLGFISTDEGRKTQNPLKAYCGI
ncbi:probable 2-oxoglutarate-dependent dioxygenase AOP1 isoform X1 [Coffea eugenioides]|uniref:probable 2-oxoglutarate-dependent dioxygenase AOP1 isoform X1 n=1 Tax=Coffea eugenioides TaxID=49369 RepID=UPI000F6120C8|nr:probable 2-oxoglutarate-dependent dioxygenase AOP1 isoform X1 [Coffea eugenioides]